MKKFIFNDIDFTTLATSTCLYGSSFQLSDLAKKEQIYQKQSSGKREDYILSE
jgi:hypothetical protein